MIYFLLTTFKTFITYCPRLKLRICACQTPDVRKKQKKRLKLKTKDLCPAICCPPSHKRVPVAERQRISVTPSARNSIATAGTSLRAGAVLLGHDNAPNHDPDLTCIAGVV